MLVTDSRKEKKHIITHTKMSNPVHLYDSNTFFSEVQIGYLNTNVYLTVILFRRPNTLSPNARQARIASLESMVTISSNTLVAMASQLSEAEERERAFSGRSRWNQLRSMGDAKGLLQYIFNVAADARLPLFSFGFI